MPANVIVKSLFKSTRKPHWLVLHAVQFEYEAENRTGEQQRNFFGSKRCAPWRWTCLRHPGNHPAYLTSYIFDFLHTSEQLSDPSMNAVHESSSTVQLVSLSMFSKTELDHTHFSILATSTITP